MVDKLEIVRQFLAQEGHNYVATNRVPAGFDNTHPLIVLSAETGAAHVSGADYTDTVACRCYGGDNKDSSARAVFAALYDSLLLPGNHALGAGTLKQAFYLSDFPGPDDPVTGWPTHIGRFQIAMEA